MVILLPLIGLTQGVQSVIAYFHGSNDMEKEYIVKSKIVKYSLIYSLTLTVLVYLFTYEITKVFTNNIELAIMSVPIMRIIVVGFPFLGIIYTLITFMQVSGDENSASRLELIRQTVLLIPLVIILSKLFSEYNIMNLEPQVAIFFSMPISSILLLCIYNKKIKFLYKKD